MLLTTHERAILSLLRSSGRRERGGLDAYGLSTQTGFSYIEVTLLLVALEHHQLVCSALVDDGRDDLMKQRRLWYLTKAAMAT